MLNILVFSGGTGSIAIQNGLSEIYGNDTYNLDIIINAYDNGKSTGVCRNIFNNKILGPSDLRKNHMTQFSIQKREQLKDYHSRESFLHKLFEMRMNAITKEAYYEKGCSLLDLYADLLGENDYLYLKSLLEFFFFEDKGNNEWRKTLSSVSFNDFSLANIFYSSAAAMNGNSLRLAGKDIAKVLDIKDNVHLISDVNLFLKAYTESGHLIEDEGDIVKWDNPNDKIQEVFLEKEGEEYVPHVDEGTDLVKVKSCEELIKNADIIIFSSGTQWSSLIPTYMHSGFRKILEKSDAKKYLVVNNVEDHDMKGVNADRIIEILGKYIPLDSVTAVVNDDAVEGMDKVYKIKNIHAHIGGEKDKHDPKKLIQLIMKDYFGLTEKEKTYVYDLDGTIWDERANEKGKLIGKQNLKLFKGIIHSGNRYEHVRDVFKYMYDRDDVVHIYSDFGNVHFTSNDFTKISCQIGISLTNLYVLN